MWDYAGCPLIIHALPAWCMGLTGGCPARNDIFQPFLQLATEHEAKFQTNTGGVQVTCTNAQQG